ncbi:MAG: hypothetical protein ACFBWO_04580 [Paracoccaceae bacterium]
MLRLLAALCLLLALGLRANDAWRSWGAGGWAPLALGELWSRLHPPSLQQLQPAIERHVDPALWDPVLAVLLAPAALDVAVLGLVFAALARVSRPRRRRRG